MFEEIVLPSFSATRAFQEIEQWYKIVEPGM